jgi:Zn finger protein HypA/HybF involved in hydrogenase expression
MDAEWRLWCEDCALEVPEEPEAHDLHNCMCDTCDEDRAELGYVRARRF